MYQKLWLVATVVLCLMSRCRSHPVEFSTDNCGQGTHCFKDPAGCEITDSGCRFYSWMKAEDGSYRFTMSGGTGGGEQYIAMALGLVDKMQDADLYYCDGKAVRTGAIQELHTPPAYYEMTGGLMTILATTSNGVAHCEFARPASVTKTISNDTMHNFDITKEEYHLLGAIGPMDGTKVKKHDTWINVTEYTINFAGENRRMTEGCGESKQCYSDPTNCEVEAADCRFFAWEKASDGSYNFEMAGGMGSETDQQSYIALALGTMNLMQDADLYYCDGKEVKSGVIQKRHEPPTYLDNKSIKTKSASVKNGIVHCIFNRPASVTKEISDGVMVNFDLAKDNYYLLGAVGRIAAGALEKHSWATVTSQKMVPMQNKIFAPAYEEVEMEEF